MKLNYIIMLLAAFTAQVFAADPSLYIQAPGKEIIYTRTQLLARPDVTVLTTTSDPMMRGKSFTYTVVPAAALFKEINIPDDADIYFHALDSFSAPIEKKLFLNTSDQSAVAYIAIEKAGEKWPEMQMGHEEKSAGPFYLVWKNPEKSRVSTELWVMQLAGFTIGESFAKLYPNVAPDKNASAEVMQGFKVFRTNCFSCHTVNRQGNSKIGPDLNVPNNPTEYMHDKYLRIFIRNPQSLRHWPQDRMNAFPAAVINDKELDDLIAYLKYMSSRKVK